MKMKNRILERVDEAIETIKPVVENRMPYRKWKMHIELLWDNTFGILFEYTEDLSDTKDGKLLNKYELSNQFWYSESKPGIVEYSLTKFTDKDREIVKKEDIHIDDVANIPKEKIQTESKAENEKKQEENPPVQA